MEKSKFKAIGRAVNGEELMDRADLATAINVESETGAVPEWVELIPAGRVKGRDGRKWVNDRPDDIVAAFAGEGKDLVIDLEHASEHKAPQGDPAPAVGWIGAVENRDGAIWGKVAWTPRGSEAIENREYRYISPVFHYEKGSRRIVQLVNAGLTNMPNLRLTALNQQRTEKETVMWKRLLAKLGLSEDATEETAINAVESLQGDLATARNRAETPPLEKFVPRADYDGAVARATNAEQKLADREKADLDAAVDREIGAALKAGKITPATKEYYTGMCRQEGGLEAFRKFVEVATPVVPDTTLGDKELPDKGKALNAQELEVIERMGISAEEYQKAGG